MLMRLLLVYKWQLRGFSINTIGCKQNNERQGLVLRVPYLFFFSFTSQNLKRSLKPILTASRSFSVYAHRDWTKLKRSDWDVLYGPQSFREVSYWETEAKVSILLIINAFFMSKVYRWLNLFLKTRALFLPVLLLRHKANECEFIIRLHVGLL